MLRRLIVLLLIYILSVHCFDDNWHCGIGSISKVFSFAVAWPSDTDGINTCCHSHDRWIDSGIFRRSITDDMFCDCLENHSSWYVRNIVKGAYCLCVRTYTLFSD